MRCDFEGMASDAAQDEPCAAFLEAFQSSHRSDIARIALAAPTARSATATAYRADGTVVASLQFDVSDAEMRPAMWRSFARDFVRTLNAME